ncbi:branched-chain amino acid ABC transporter, permease [Deferribacter desulfuricans SSM1]|uniref:Branched-chain amino acid ABC transporter, permease n=1 Tax=Deferribacter desulfuricans (strain DSM 14783 / JCM 11476 / NBRC 101012 / SSM1) TaxID=639282 RepID=D3PCV9_DEFDS|nr:branched-chain amino acid ABC transporter permease [Deferribacter desulfuricans]BAI80432.1 branched-chain amino acid ABC transporter, permease [Deferribacter desulfuricans SSM1]
MNSLNKNFFIINFILIILIGLFLKNEYYLSLISYILINAMLASGLNILLGYAGIISLCQASFFGIGAYLSGILTVHYSYSPIATVFIGAIITFIVAILIAYPTLKLHGHYLAMATLGFGMIIYIFANELDIFTGGPSGLVGIPYFSLFGFEFDTELKNYALFAFLYLITVVLLELFDKSFLSYDFRFIRESEHASSAFGIDFHKEKVILFAVIASFSSIIGSFYSFYSQFISPTSIGINYSIEILAMVIIGGLGSTYGGIIGAIIISLIPELFASFEDYEILIYGGILAFCIIFFPYGINGIFKRLKVAKN